MRYARELLLPVVFAMRRLKSAKNDMERGPQTPEVSKATGVKEWYAWEVMSVLPGLLRYTHFRAEAVIIGQMGSGKSVYAGYIPNLTKEPW